MKFALSTILSVTSIVAFANTKYLLVEVDNTGGMFDYKYNCNYKYCLAN